MSLPRPETRRKRVANLSEQEAFDWQGMSVGFPRHAQFPVGMGQLPQPLGLATGVGQCGDSVQVGIRVEEDTIRDIGVLPRGCVYTVACASALAALTRGRTVEAALQLSSQDIEKELGGLPEDHLHCARLAVNTLGEAIEDYLRRTGLGQAVAAAQRSET